MGGGGLGGGSYSDDNSLDCISCENFIGREIGCDPTLYDNVMLCLADVSHDVQLCKCFCVCFVCCQYLGNSMVGIDCLSIGGLYHY